MRIGLVDGPGHHGPLMIAQLVARGHEVVFTRSHPSFGAFEQQSESAPRPVTRRVDRIAHDTLRRLASMAQFRLRTRLRSSYDFDLYSRLYGKLAAHYFADTDAVIGFGHVAYDAHKLAEQRGRRTVLEVGGTHLLAHTSIVDEEYRQAGQLPTSEGFRFSRFAVERACAEYQQADLINVLSTYAKKTLVDRGIAPEKVIVSPLGVDTDRFHPNASAPAAHPFRVLFVGRIELAKGIRYLLEAFGQLRLPDAELWLVGKLSPEARPFLDAHPRSVIIRPPMPPDELAACYRQADVLVFPTISDGLGLVMLEAMASGLPVIATNHSGGPDVLREAEDGFVVPSRDSKALAERILWLYDHPDARSSMGLNARARAEALLSQERYGERLEQGIIAAVQSTTGREK